jgi:hypothetical protein
MEYDSRRLEASGDFNDFCLQVEKLTGPLKSGAICADGSNEAANVPVGRCRAEKLYGK